ncbi:MAG: hypothetical protein IJP92_12665 [Lachnospiraceae bacterium]|nr:hypothetical protein [Lachnospiraceae bacterium]
MKRKLTALICALTMALTPMAALAAEDSQSVGEKTIAKITPDAEVRSWPTGVIWRITVDTPFRTSPSYGKNNILGWVVKNDKFRPGIKSGAFQSANMISGAWNGYDAWVLSSCCTSTNNGYYSVGDVME